MRSLPRILQKFYGEPWMIHPPAYESLHRQLQARLQRRGAQSIALDDDDEDMPSPAARRCDMDCLSQIEIKDGVAIVPIAGVIGKHLSMMEMICGGYDLQTLQDQTLALQNRADVHTVIFRIDSPGGIAAALSDSAQMIMDMGKRTIAYADYMAASAGYWLAAACDEIHVGSGSIVGSIGTIIGMLDESKAFELEGLKMEVFTGGTLKGIGYAGTSLTAEQRAWVQAQIDHLTDGFRAFVRSRRAGVKDDAMQGQWFTGDQAIAAGLADAISPSIYHVAAAALQR